MAFVVKSCYVVVCDNCHKQLNHGNGFFDDPVKANVIANYYKWRVKNTKHYCPECSNKLFK